MKFVGYSLALLLCTPAIAEQFPDCFLQPNDLVFDVGSFTGETTDHYLSCKARVVSIEPQTHFNHILQKRYNDNPNVTVITKGLAAYHGELPLYICNNWRPFCTYSNRWRKYSRYANKFGANWTTYTMTKVITLDELIDQHGRPRYCKISTCGYEPEVLRGLNTPIEYLSFEFHAELFNHLQLCLAELRRLGYRSFNLSLTTSNELILSKWVSENAFVSVLQEITQKYPWVCGLIHAHYERKY